MVTCLSVSGGVAEGKRDSEPALLKYWSVTIRRRCEKLMDLMAMKLAQR